MLILSRKPGESIKVGSDVVVTITAVVGNRVKVGIAAPREVRVVRSELAKQDGDQAGAGDDHRERMRC